MNLGVVPAPLVKVIFGVVPVGIILVVSGLILLLGVTIKWYRRKHEKNQTKNMDIRVRAGTPDAG